MRQRYIIQFALVLLLLTGSTSATAQTYTEKSLLSEGRWVKIRVDAEGVYQLTASDLRAMGFSNPDRVQLFGMNMEQLPETQIENIGDDMIELPLYRTGDRLLFYGRGTRRWTLTSTTANMANFTHANNPYSSSIYYFLTENSSAEPRAFEKYAYSVSSSARTQTTFPDHVIIETDAYSFLRSGRTFFEAYDYATNKTRNYELNLPGLVSEGTNINLSVQFGAAGQATSSLSILFNGEQVGTLSFAALGDFMFGVVSSRNMMIPSPASENNTVTLTHDRASGISGHLDYIRASYVRRLEMAGNTMLFRPATNGDIRFEMKGGTAETVFWHINNTEEIEELDASYDSATGTWSIPFSCSTTTSTAWRGEEILAVNPSATYPTPVNCGAIANQNLHGLKDIDLVIVVPTSGKLTSQAKRLADAHAKRDGMRCVVLPAQQIYNEFSAGTPDATAIRRLMKMLYDRADSPANQPKNILLFGLGVWDNRMITNNMRGKNPDDYLLTYQSENSVHTEYSYVLEDYFTLLDNNTTGNVLLMRPRIGVGRIPVTSSHEAQVVVDKLITYINNEQVGNWKNTICLMADDGNNNQHMQDADSVIKDLGRKFPDFRVRRIYWDTYSKEVSSTGESYPGATSDIDRQMQEGALIMNYTGHGAAYCLSHEMVLRTADFARWNSPRLPLWVTAACDVSPFDMEEENIGQTALLNPRGASMGILTTTRTVLADANRELNRRFTCNVLDHDDNGNQYTIGQALSLAKCSLLAVSSNSINKAHFIILGDPAIRLAIPTFGITIDRINEMYAPGTPYNASAGSLVTVEGHITDTEGNTATDFNGIIYPLVQDNLETVVTNQNGGSDKPHTYTDRLRTLYTCADYVKDGQFKFSFPIPLDNNYSGEEGLISLYAANNEATVEANGRFTNFTVSGTASELPDDKQGPIVQMYLNDENFREGDVVNETPLLFVTLEDENGLNMTGSGIGHDITAIVDNKEAWTYSLNSYFTPTVGDYRKGSITFSVPELTEGQHTLRLRAYDILNNPSTTDINFYVNVGAAPDIYDLRIASMGDGVLNFTFVTNRPQTDLDITMSVYDITGRKLWQQGESGFSVGAAYTFTWNTNETDSHMPQGIYIVKATVRSNGGDGATLAKKFIMTK